MVKQNVYKRLRDLEKEMKNIKEKLHREEQNKQKNEDKESDLEHDLKNITESEQENEQENDQESEEEETNNNICELYVEEVEMSSISQKIHNFTLLLVPTLLAWGISLVSLYLKH
jgi:hypothetical protein